MPNSEARKPNLNANNTMHQSRIDFSFAFASTLVISLSSRYLRSIAFSSVSSLLTLSTLVKYYFTYFPIMRNGKL